MDTATKIKGLAIDLDGTLLVGEDLSPRNRDALKSAHQQGLFIVIATARWRQLAERVSAEVGLTNMPIIACSGAQVFCTRTGQDIFDERLPLEFVQELYDICNQNRCIASATVNNHTWLKLDQEPAAEFLSDELKWVEQLPAPTEIPRIATVQGSATIAKVRALHQAQYSDSVNIFDSIGPSGKIVITITSKKADKGIALSRACEHLEVDPVNFIAFGDADNDIAMFARAGQSVAMGQADDSVKARATHSTKANFDDGVAHFIEQELL